MKVEGIQTWKCGLGTKLKKELSHGRPFIGLMEMLAGTYEMGYHPIAYEGNKVLGEGNLPSHLKQSTQMVVRVFGKTHVAFRSGVSVATWHMDE